MTQDPNRAAMREALAALPADVREQAVDAVADELRGELDILLNARGALHRNLLAGDSYIAIHDDDLKILPEAATVAAAAYAAFPNPVSVLSGLVVLVFRYLRKQVRLTLLQGLALKAIDEHTPAGATLAEIEQSVPAEFAGVPLKAALDELQRLRKEDGTEAKLIEQKGDRYYALDV